MSDTTTFQGFPRECVAFLEGLTANNSKEWFDDHREDYDTHVLAPARAFIAAMGERLREIAPDVVADGRVNQSLFRINRDVRFSKDKSPYKTHLGVWLWEGSRPRMECSGFYFHLEASSLMLGSGVYELSKPMLGTFREAVLDDRRGPALAAAIDAVKANGLEVGGQTYKRVPQGYDKDHERADLLRFGGLHVGKTEPIPEALFGPELIEHCFAAYRQMAPLHEWLREMIQHAGA